MPNILFHRIRAKKQPSLVSNAPIYAKKSEPR